MAKSEWTESSVLDALETKYPGPPQWVFLRHVPNGTSSQKTRTADAMAIGCWNSVGIALHGHEVKISRGDWLKEIQDISKAEACSHHCHFWWVVSPDGIVKIEEMPANWGLLVVSKKEDGYSLRVRKAATKNESAHLDYDFFAAALRKCRTDDPQQIELKKKMGEEYWRGIKEGEKRGNVDARIIALEKAYTELKATVREFESSSGIQLRQYSHATKAIGNAVNTVLFHGDDIYSQLDELSHFCDQMKRQAEDFAKARSIVPIDNDTANQTSDIDN